MILVTGGAGFIGSNVVAALAERGAEVVVADWLGTDERWRNLAGHEIAGLLAPDQCLRWAEDSPDLRAVVHLGAISATTETDAEQLAEWNIRYSLNLFEICVRRDVRLVYASSAATYGDGQAGFDDRWDAQALARLRPLNAYGWSKHVVDRRILRRMSDGASRAKVAGLKFFNVYGPNEYHKGEMRSVACKAFETVREGRPVRLFRSHHPDYPDGGQLRDFVYVRDCVDVVLWLLDHPEVRGLYNMGSGLARSFLDLVNAVHAAMEREPAIEYVDTPTAIRDKYQYYTQARMQRLREQGYDRPFTSLEDGVEDYVRRYLASENPYR